MTSMPDSTASVQSDIPPGDTPMIRPTQTKIIATIGPASSDRVIVRKLIEAGVRIFRLNFSHGDLNQHSERVATIRDVGLELNRSIAIFGDLQGPKIRVGPVAEGGVFVPTGTIVIFQREDDTVSADDRSPRFTCTYPGVIDDVVPGQRMLINDGAVRMLIIEKSADEIVCSVMNGGLITTGKGINLPDSTLNVKIIGERDWKNVRWAVEHELDCLALSFVRSALDVQELKDGLERIQSEGKADYVRMPVIAKIELPQAVQNIQEILVAADGIMIARGDLGVEMDLASLPVIQKKLLKAAQDHGKPTIVATQMLETMITSTIPTRAEASDVAGAVFDEADAVMLSGETAVGEYPVIAVETMRRIVEQTESYLATQSAHDRPPVTISASNQSIAALTHGVWTIANDIGANLIVVWTKRGHGARFLSQNTFHVPIVGVTSDLRVARQMQFFRSVIPIVMPVPENLADMVAQVDRRLMDSGLARKGDPTVLVSGGPLGDERIPHRLAIHTIGDSS